MFFVLIMDEAIYILQRRNVSRDLSDMLVLEAENINFCSLEKPKL